MRVKQVPRGIPEEGIGVACLSVCTQRIGYLYEWSFPNWLLKY